VSIKFYDDNAESFFNDTVNVDLNAIYQHFLPKLSRNAHILDAGCGSGRDSKYFIEQGFHVTAFDASKTLAEKASEYSGITVSVDTFESFNCALTPLNKQSFDAIWACASLLHVASAQLPKTFTNLAKQLKPNGIFYCSFKYGDTDIERNGRNFTNANEKRLAQFIKNTDLVIKNTWLTGDARPDRQDEKWLNAILIKQ
jgi:2-polyprenyl-3-methyl-5-hydroxy-6-metoxy-1,4-benzoquinol methylase